MKVFKLLILNLIILIIFVTAHAQPKNFTDAEREQMAKAAVQKYIAAVVADPGYTKSETHLKRIWQIDPANYEALSGLGDYWKQAKFWGDARRWFRLTTQAYPDKPSAYLQWGMMEFEVGNSDATVGLLKKYLSLASGGEPQAFKYLAAAQYFVGDFRGCTENYGKFFSSAQGETDDYLKSGECNFQIGNYEQAKADLARANSSGAVDYWRVPATVVEKGDKSCKTSAAKAWEKASEKVSGAEYDKAYVIIFNGLKCQPDDYNLLRLRLLIELRENQGTDKVSLRALTHYRLLLRKNPEIKDARYDEGAGLSFKDRMPKWATSEDYAPKITVNDYINLARKSYDGKFDYAIYPQMNLVERLENLNYALLLDPGNKEALALRAIVFAGWGKTGEFKDLAYRDATAALKLDPRAARAYTARGLVLMQEKNESDASAEFSRALEIDPNDDLALINRGKLKFARGDASGARQDITRAIEIAPRIRGYYAVRAGLFASVEDYQKAVDPNGGGEVPIDAWIDYILLLYRNGDTVAAKRQHLAFYNGFKPMLGFAELSRYSLIKDYYPEIEQVAKGTGEVQKAAMAQQEWERVYALAQRNAREFNRRDRAYADLKNTGQRAEGTVWTDYASRDLLLKESRSAWLSLRGDYGNYLSPRQIEIMNKALANIEETYQKMKTP